MEISILIPSYVFVCHHSVFIEIFLSAYIGKICLSQTSLYILSKNVCGLYRKKALKLGDIETTRDYAERLSFELNNEIMSQHFVNSISLSTEDVCVQFSNALPNLSKVQNVQKFKYLPHCVEL